MSSVITMHCPPLHPLVQFHHAVTVVKLDLSQKQVGRWFFRKVIEEHSNR